MVSILSYALSMGLYFTLLILFIGWMRKSVWSSLIFWGLSLIAVPVMFIMGDVEGWFRWTKVFSVIIPLIILGFARVSRFKEKQGKFWRFFDRKWILVFTYLVLTINILEATLKGFSLGNTPNAIAGLALIITTPLPIRYWTIEKEKRGDLLAFTTMMWNILYTTWNAAFVYGESPSFVASSICILMAALLYTFIKGKNELWGTARIYTLGLHLVIRGCVPQVFLTYMDATAWHNATFQHWWGVFNAVLGIGYVAWYIVAMVRKKYQTKLVEEYDTVHQFDKA